MSEAGSAEVRGARLAFVGGLAALVLFTFLLVQRVEPVTTWFYLFAWYPVLLSADAAVALTGAAGRRGEFLLLSRPRHMVSVLLWSAVIWLFYELFNFRLQNWYYVFVPEDRAVRWFFTVVAFATVLPAVFLSEALLHGFGVARAVRWTRLRLTRARLLGLQLVGVFFLALVLLWPRWFFPLVWGGTTLIVEPWVYRRDPGRSILGDLEAGEPGRLLRLLLGGMAIGLLWEALNIGARAKWIYTVPGLEELKLFEMPVLGFFGFPPFAVECFVLWQALVLLGVAVPRAEAPSSGLTRTPTVRRYLAGGLAVLFSVGVLYGMEDRTWDSYRPSLDALPGIPAPGLAAAGYDVFDLASAGAGEVAERTDTAEAAARAWIERARLAALRGIGAENAALLGRVGIGSVAELAATNPARLHRDLEELTGERFVAARVRVWVRAARREAGVE